MNWLTKQLTTPSTHVALATVASALMNAGVLTGPYGLIAVGVFAALGILVPEAGEGALPVPMPAVTGAMKILPFIVFLSALVACAGTTPQLQSAACIGQSVANAVGASATADGNTMLAGQANAASIGFGGLCTGLATDTPLTVTPAPVNALPAKPAS